MCIGVLLSSCAAGPDSTGLEYAPQMYHSTPYEPLTQITDESQGTWLDSNDEDGHGEFYNSNPYNQFGMNMRKPVANTVKRGTLLQQEFGAGDEQLALAAETLISPYDSLQEGVVKQGQELYDRFCEHCHGTKGNGDGLVAEKYAGVANLNGAAYLNITEGHIFHVITYGKGLMGAHGSQISAEDRWKIARYVKQMQNSN
ncbi:MAG: cytochrome c [Ekhidna sp.]|nr:cytochrome c [Ekhidna sp.]MBC6409590.1 cytochrome c [Ekhidna sp.]MBC6425658.1 cytochrome c [Ekhidna sp.]